MSKVQVIGWRATGYSAYRHYWKSRPHTDLAVARCGQIVHKKFLVERTWKIKCSVCDIYLDGEVQISDV